MAPSSSSPKDAVSQQGMKQAIERAIEEIQELYLWDEIPWVVGYSGGKDSTATLQLVWMAIHRLSSNKRNKSIHVISTDTLVEQPIVASWVEASHTRMKQAAEQQQLPIHVHRLSPETKDTFWVNLIGRGYPAPRKLFRWCTSRMKINPSNSFIRNVVHESGEAIVVLGTRKAESQRRAQAMAHHEAKKVRDRLTPNASLPNSLVYTPIEDWSNDDVWLYLMQVKNPWGHSNRSLLGMYQGASEDGECPLVVDTSTPSCGSSRFGCWTCTLVDKDRSMEAMIKNDSEKVWMTPLLELRNELGDFSKDPERRDYRRMSGKVQLFHDGLIRGPYRKTTREYWMTRVLEVQAEIRRLGPREFSKIDLISFPELHEIRRIWLNDKHEFDDALPRIYEEVTGQPFPTIDDDDRILGADDWQLLEELCGTDVEFLHLQTKLLDIERQFRGFARRTGIFRAIEDCVRASQFGDEETALAVKREEAERRSRAGEVQRPLRLKRGSEQH